MSAINEEKFKQMQDEMSRFEEEIGLPLPDVAPPPPPMPILPPPPGPKVISANTYNEAQKQLAGIPTSVDGSPLNIIPPPPPPLPFIPHQVRGLPPRPSMDGGRPPIDWRGGPLPPGPPMPPGPPLPPGPPMPQGPLPPPPPFGMLGPMGPAHMGPPSLGPGPMGPGPGPMGPGPMGPGPGPMGPGPGSMGPGPGHMGPGPMGPGPMGPGPGSMGPPGPPQMGPGPLGPGPGPMGPGGMGPGGMGPGGMGPGGPMGPPSQVGSMGPPGPGPMGPGMIPPSFNGSAFPGHMNQSRFAPPTSQENKPQQSVPAVLSATPMMYVANPQLEIAAIQAESQNTQVSQPELPLEDTKKSVKKNNKSQEGITTQITTVPGSKKDRKKNKKLIRTAGGQTWEDPTLAEWEDDDFRLFCGDLGNDVTDEVLTRAFSKYPSFLKARVVRDKRTNKTKGFGFVSFKDPQDFIRATKEMNGRYVGSRPIKLRKSSWKNRSLEVVRKKDKEKQQLIAMLTGR